ETWWVRKRENEATCALGCKGRGPADAALRLCDPGKEVAAGRLLENFISQECLRPAAGRGDVPNDGPLNPIVPKAASLIGGLSRGASRNL
ncbi:hypothetical protein P7K49_009251, partial [Saguinus oedipus]